MPRARSTPHSVARQSAELAFAAPQVVAHRVGRMARAGFNPSAADQREFAQMGSEKVLAFSQGWMAMAQHLMHWQTTWWQAAMGLWLRPGPQGLGAMSRHWQQLPMQPWHTLGAGLAPVHAKAVSNARRLGRHRR